MPINARAYRGAYRLFARTRGAGASLALAPSMALFRYFKKEKGNLPDPRGPLAQSVPSTCTYYCSVKTKTPFFQKMSTKTVTKTQDNPKTQVPKIT